jgi:mono/diheme cytochrome c family protein
MSRRLLLALVLGILLAGCGGEETVAPTAETVVGTVPGEIDLSAGDPQAGKNVFNEVAQPACGSCHTYGPAGSNQTLGPNLDDALADKDRQFILESIVNPDAEVTQGFADNLMPEDYGQKLNEEQLADLVAFLKPQS